MRKTITLEVSLENLQTVRTRFTEYSNIYLGRTNLPHDESSNSCNFTVSYSQTQDRFVRKIAKEYDCTIR